MRRVSASASRPTSAQSPKAAAAKRILVVEDQEPLRKFTQAILARAGYDVAVAANGAEAVAAVENESFDLVLMDVHMPVMDGPAATARIRAFSGARSTVPIIAFSGDGQWALKTGMDDHIGKPFRNAALLDKVRTWLRADSPPQPIPSLPAKAKAERAAFREACQLMGKPWALRGLVKLRVQIDQIFGTKPESAPDLEQLASRAHALAPLAALLGFAALSELCGTLEEACRGRHDVRLPLTRARAAALRARKAAAALIAGDSAA